MLNIYTRLKTSRTSQENIVVSQLNPISSTEEQNTCSARKEALPPKSDHWTSGSAALARHGTYGFGEKYCSFLACQEGVD